MDKSNSFHKNPPLKYIPSSSDNNRSSNKKTYIISPVRSHYFDDSSLPSDFTKIKPSYFSSLALPTTLNAKDLKAFMESYNRIDLDANTQLLEFNAKQYVSPFLNEQDILQLKEVFDTFDYNGNGILSPNDLKNALISYGYQVNKETVYDIIAEYDEDESGGLSFKEFLRMITNSLMNNKKNIKEKNEIERVFRKYDPKNKGYIDFECIKKMVDEFEEEVNESELKDIIKKIDSNQDGRISYEDFYKVMTSKEYL